MPISVIMLGLVVMTASCESCPTHIWVEGDGLPTPTIERVDLSGRGGPGTGFRFLVERFPTGTVRVSGFIADRHSGVVELDAERFPEIDFGSLTVGFDAARQLVELTVKFGETNRCFANDDGRNRLKLYFRPGYRERLYSTTIRDCEATTEEIGLR